MKVSLIAVPGKVRMGFPGGDAGDNVPAAVKGTPRSRRFGVQRVRHGAATRTIYPRNRRTSAKTASNIATVRRPVFVL